MTTKKVITPRAILSYPKLAKAEAGGENQKPKFSCALVFTREAIAAQPEAFQAIKTAIMNAAKEKWSDKAEAMFRTNKLKNPLRSTDAEEKDGYPAGSYFLNARSDTRPGCVYAHAGADGKPAVIALEDIEEQCYPGAIVRASLSFYSYDREGNRGVGVALNNIQKLADGERLDSRVKAQDEFDVDLTAEPASLDDVLGVM
jgi:hypothetical protein